LSQVSREYSIYFLVFSDFTNETHLPITCIAYNLAALNGTNLALSAEIIASIYLGEITKWNDSRIQALNPNIIDLLPNQNITVVLENVTSAQAAFTYWLNATVPSWYSLVCRLSYFLNCNIIYYFIHYTTIIVII
jgi:hypothetical protein